MRSAARLYGFGAAFTETWAPRFSTELAVGAEEPKVCVGGSSLERTCTVGKVTTDPVDLNARYQFLTESRWKRYIGAGVRYVRAPDLTPELEAAKRGHYPDHVDPEIVGGVAVLITQSLAIRVDAKQRVGTSEQYDPTLKVSAGPGWRPQALMKDRSHAA